MPDIQGRRREDTDENKLPDDIQVGDYWKILKDGVPKIDLYSDKLTEECWHVVVPMGDEEGFGIANLCRHTVRENEDGTISVLPGDGSSNSILVSSRYKGVERQWHGYIYDGVLRSV